MGVREAAPGGGIREAAKCSQMTLGRIAGDSARGKCSGVFWKAGKILRWNENKGRHQEGY